MRDRFALWEAPRQIDRRPAKGATGPSRLRSPYLVRLAVPNPCPHSGTIAAIFVRATHIDPDPLTRIGHKLRCKDPLAASMPSISTTGGYAGIARPGGSEHC